MTASPVSTLTKRQKLRGYDAIQLAAALVLSGLPLHIHGGSVLFVAADNNLLSAAQSEGLDVDNPNAHP